MIAWLHPDRAARCAWHRLIEAYVRAAARFFSVRRETSGNVPDKEGGHQDAVATQR
jgi:hypothetical protein